MFSNYLNKLKGKEVEIRAAGVTYKGKLLEIAAEYVFLRRSQGYAQIPMDRIQSIKAAAEAPPPLRRDIAPQFFEMPESTTDKDTDSKNSN